VKNVGLGTGRRKTSVARIYLREGSGKITINNKDLDEYFVQSIHRFIVRQPLLVTSSGQKFDILINVYGGGINGQAGACRQAIARSLCQYDQANYTSLRANGFLTRDSRMVERKKYGRRGARRRFQFSKR